MADLFIPLVGIADSGTEPDRFLPLGGFIGEGSLAPATGSVAATNNNDSSSADGQPIIAGSVAATNNNDLCAADANAIAPSSAVGAVSTVDLNDMATISANVITGAGDSCSFYFMSGDPIYLMNGDLLTFVNCPTEGGHYFDYRAYRKKLEDITRAADRRLYKKVKKKILQVPRTAPPQVKNIVEQIKIEIDFDAIANKQSALLEAKLQQLLQQLDILLQNAIDIEREEEELILLFALS